MASLHALVHSITSANATDWPSMVHTGVQYETLTTKHLASYAVFAVAIICILRSTCLSTLESFKYEKKRKSMGCGEIAKYPHREPFFGLDVVLGMASALRQNRYLVWLNKVHEKKPKTFLVNFVRSRFIWTIEPENVKAMSAVVWKDFAVSPTRRNNKATYPFADKGVSTVDGAEWEHARFLIKPFFQREVYTNTERLRVHTDRFFDILPGDGESFDIQPLLQRWFLDVNSDSLFGESIGSLGHPERASIIWAMRDVLRFLRLRLQWYKYLFLFRNQAWLDCVGEVHDFINKQMKRTYAELKEFERMGKDPHDGERKDLIWYIASYVKNPDELRSHLSLMFVPNNDTTSIFISHILWNVARRPDIWERLRKEVLAHGDNGLDFEVLRNMKYLNGVLNETHRLYPNGVTQVRMCIKDTTLPVGGGPDGTEPIFVRKGDVVQANKNVMHRDPDIWGPDALEFKPERWDGMRPYWNFVPFGGGARRCPAQFLVMTEAAYMLARLLRIYKRIEARDPAPYVGVMRVGPSNLTGVQVALYKD